MPNMLCLIDNRECVIFKINDDDDDNNDDGISGSTTLAPQDRAVGPLKCIRTLYFIYLLISLMSKL